MKWSPLAIGYYLYHRLLVLYQSHFALPFNFHMGSQSPEEEVTLQSHTTISSLLPKPLPDSRQNSELPLYSCLYGNNVPVLYLVAPTFSVSVLFIGGLIIFTPCREVFLNTYSRPDSICRD